MKKSKLVRKVFALCLAFSLMMTSSMVVFAESSMDGGGSSSSKHSSGGSSSSSSTKTPAPKTPSVVSVGGQTVKTTVDGVYSAPNVNGSAIITAKTDVNAAVGLAYGEAASVRITSSNYGPQARQCVADTAAALHVTAGPVVDINLGKIGKSGKYVNVQKLNAPVVFTIGIPSSFASPGSTFYMINVRPGGEVALLQDMDSDPNTITFATADCGVFALARQ